MFVDVSMFTKSVSYVCLGFSLRLTVSSCEKVRDTISDLVHDMPFLQLFTVPSYDETTLLRRLSFPIFERRFVWACDRKSRLGTMPKGKGHP